MAKVRISARGRATRLQSGQRPPSAPPGVTLADNVRRRLEAEISGGRLEPGARLDEQEVALRFGVSRTPVREAFRLLAASHFVELRGRQGVAVRTVGAHQLIEMFQVMAELEGLCARLAARRIMADGMARLEVIHRRLEAAARQGEADPFYDVNQEFHEAIYEAARNAFLADQTRRLRNQLAAYRRRVTRMPNRIADTLAEHQAVIDAIAAHDGERAHAAMRAHVNLLGDDLVDFLAAFE
jgi:DNA-binding GntR family transcriptional regulator